MDGVIDAKAENQRGHRGFKRCEHGSREVENAVRPDQCAGQSNQREHNLIHRTERNTEHDNHDQKGQANQHQEVVKRPFVDVMGQQIVGDDLSNKCTVYSLKKINNQNVLTIVSDSAEILEVSYSAEDIKEKINKFFFSEFISVIKFKKSLQI